MLSPEITRFPIVLLVSRHLYDTLISEFNNPTFDLEEHPANLYVCLYVLLTTV